MKTDNFGDSNCLYYFILFAIFKLIKIPLFIQIYINMFLYLSLNIHFIVYSYFLINFLFKKIY